MVPSCGGSDNCQYIMHFLFHCPVNNHALTQHLLNFNKKNTIIIIEPSNSRRTLHNINNTQRHRITTQEICLKDQQPGDNC